MYAKVVAHTGRSRVRVGAILVAAAIAALIVVTLAGGATAANQHSKAVTHRSRTTAHLENNPSPGSRDVGFTG